MLSLLKNFQSKLLAPKSIIFSPKDKPILTFINSGTCEVYRSYLNLQNGKMYRIKIVTLHEGSWFGDFSILMKCDPSFEF